MKPKQLSPILIAAFLLISLAALTPFKFENPDPEIQSPESGRYLYVASEKMVEIHLISIRWSKQGINLELEGLKSDQRHYL